MSRVRIQKDRSAEAMLVSPEKLSTGTWAEISNLLFNYGGLPRGSSVVISPLSLRRAAQDLGYVLKHQGIDVDYDDAARQLLQLHLEEVQARRSAEQDLSSLSEGEVLRRVSATRRFTRELTAPQIRDLGRLLRLRHGANFSVPGAGKTATLLATYEASRGDGPLERLLVVAPKNAFLSWEEEIALCYDENHRPTVARISGGEEKASETLRGDPEIALITYQFLPNVLDKVSAWCRNHKTHLVLDESHRIKSGLAGTYARSALQLSAVAQRRDVLSGTPMPNAPEDLRPQTEFLWPGQRILPEMRLSLDSSKEVVTQVQRCLQPLYVRTTKSELRLPPVEIVPVTVELEPLQRKLYELLRSEAKRVAEGMTISDRRFLRTLGAHVLQLIEAASNPMLLVQTELLEEGTTESLYSQTWELFREIARTERPAKIKKAIDLAGQALTSDPGHKVLIWTSFVKNVLFLEELLAQFNPVTLYGAIGTGSEQDLDTREGRIRRFHQDPSCRVMIANPAACGEGISLHQACHHAIYLDRTFNAAHYLQSIDRIHRLGLPENVVTRVEILEARWTIDARLARRLNAKIGSMSLILNDPGLATLAYDPEDLSEDFPAGIEPEDVEEIIEHLVFGDEDTTR